MCMMYHDAYALRITCGGGDPPPLLLQFSFTCGGGIPPTHYARIMHYMGGVYPPLAGLGICRYILHVATMQTNEIGFLLRLLGDCFQISYFANGLN